MTVSAESVHSMLRQAARWMVAAEQDEHPFIAVLHANYGVGTVIALRQIASDRVIFRLTGIDAWRVEQHALQIQERAAFALSRRCPQLSRELGPLGPLAREVDPGALHQVPEDSR